MHVRDYLYVSRMPMQNFQQKTTPPYPNPANKRWQSLAVVIMMILVIYLLASNEMAPIKEFIRSHGALGLAVAVVLYGLLGATVVPSEPLTLLLAGVFTPWAATLTATAGNTLAALVEYFIGLKLSHAADFEHRRSRLPFGLGKMPVSSPAFLLIGRSVPGYGSKIVSLLAGVYRVPIFRFIWTTLIPTLVGAAAIAYGGKGLTDLFTSG